MHQNQKSKDDDQVKVLVVIILVALLEMFYLGYQLGVITS